MTVEARVMPRSSPNAFLSLVTPVHHGAAFIGESLSHMLAALEGLGRPFELIVVCDGCADRSAEIARGLGDDRVVVLDYPQNHGKGHAIAHGLAAAQGRLVGWLDSDLDIDPQVIVDAALRFDEEPIDAVVGSKRHPDSNVHYPLVRRVYSWGFQNLVRLLFRINVRDTQVGGKVFRREMVDTVAPLLLIKRYAFDLEVLAVGAEFGFDRVQEAPVNLTYRFSGTGINWRAVRHMFQDTLAIAYRIHIRHWYVRRFASLQRKAMDRMVSPEVEAAAHEQAGGEAQALASERP
jgi:glycosyltransferase involved in cell wall biosynthesis